MKQMRIFAVVALAMLAVAAMQPAAAQDKGEKGQKGRQGQRPPASPPGMVSQTFDGANDNRVTVFYSRPYIRDPRTSETRTIWGGLVPYGQVWRLGANAAAHLTTQKAITIGNAELAPGVYTLYMLPSEKGKAQLIINKQVGQWGTVYDEAQDLARVEMQHEEMVAPVDPLTISLQRNQAEGGGTLRIEWADAGYSVPIKIKQ